MIRIRMAKLDDVDQLAYVHEVCSAEMTHGFLHRLGRSFLKQYYKVLLGERNSVVICAEDDDGRIVGLASGSLDASEHMKALRRNRLRLLVGGIPALLRHPSLVRAVYSRQQSVSADEHDGAYIVAHGARGEFWAWLPNERSAGGAIMLFQKWLSVMRLLGAKKIKCEVDLDNPRVEEMHRLFGAQILREFETPEGRARVVMEYP